MSYRKPFIKWAGGKGSLLGQIDDLLPHAFLGSEDVTYVEKPSSLQQIITTFAVWTGIVTVRLKYEWLLIL